MGAEARPSIAHSTVHGRQSVKQTDLVKNENEIDALVDQAAAELDALGVSERPKKSLREEPPQKDIPYSNLCVFCALNNKYPDLVLGGCRLLQLSLSLNLQFLFLCTAKQLQNMQS
jgi:hypothetical protein